MLKQDAASSDLNIDAGTLYLDVSNNRVGIANTSPANTLSVSGSMDITGTIALENSTGYGLRDNRNNLFLTSSADTVISNRTLTLGNATYNQTILSGGNVGIGTTSPQEKLHLYTTGNSRVEAESTTGFAAFKATNNSGSYGWYVDNGADKFHLFDFTDGANRITVDGSGNVGIGTTSPSFNLTTQGSSGTVTIASKNTGGSATVYIEASNTNTAKLELFEAGTGGYSLRVGNDDALMFFDDSAERMRLDSSGNLLVGTTDAALYNNTSGSGTMVNSFGRLDITRNDVMAIFNRNTSDGEIINFRKNGTTVGSIFNSGTTMGIGSLDTGVLLANNIDAILPWNASTNAERDAAIDLGRSIGRFKNLYLSGTAYVATSIGIGTSSPATGYRLDILGNSGYDDVMRITGVGTNIGPRINLTPTGTGISRINATANSLQLQTVGTAAVTIDSSQNVGIGTSSPAENLHINSSSGSARIRMTSADGSDNMIVFGDASDSATGAIKFDHSDNSLAFYGFNNSERMRIDSSGRVGIGTTDPSSGTSAYYDDLVIRNIGSGTGAGITIQSNTTNGFGAVHFRKADGTEVGKLYASSGGGQLGFETGGSERMRIDSSGTVYIGSTSDSGTNYHRLSDDGFVRHKRSGAVVAVFDRDSTDGDIILIRKNGTTVGSIGASGGLLVVGDSDCGIAFEDGTTNHIYPWNVAGGAANNDGISLGANGAAFKDLYLSGTVNAATLNIDGGTIKLGGNYPTGTSNSALGLGALASVGSGGNNNVAIGNNSLSALTFGDGNIAVGPYAMDAVTTGSNNTGLGYGVLSALTTGINNVALGKSALAVSTASRNTAVGANALSSNTTATENTAIGYATLQVVTTGGRSTAIGYGSFSSLTTSGGNVGVGYQAGAAATTGSDNVLIGDRAGQSLTTGSSNVGIGKFAMYLQTTADANTALGRDALKANVTGAGNVALGYQALEDNTASNNTAVGWNALQANTSGTQNTALGYRALDTNTTASNNTAVGYSAGTSVTTGTQNTFIGGYSGDALTTSNSNTAVGFQSLTTATTGSNNASLGALSAYNTTTGYSNVAVGYAALYSTTDGNRNVAVGQQALNTNTTGLYNVSIGHQAGYSNATGSGSTYMGYQAGYNQENTGSPYNTAIGRLAMYGAASASGYTNTAVGGSALYSISSGVSNVAVGNDALYSNTTGGANIAVGYQAGYSNTTGVYLTALGYQAGYSNTTANYNVMIGRKTGFATTTGANNAFVGTEAGVANTTGANNVALGTFSLGSNTTASDNTAVGYEAGYSTTSGTENTALGSKALRTNTTGSGNVAVGREALLNATTATENTAVGKLAMSQTTTGYGNVAVGHDSLRLNTTGSQNVAVGYDALRANITGTEITAVGFEALKSNTGTGNVAIGRRAMLDHTSGVNNTAVGTDALGNSTSATGNVAVGKSAGGSLTTATSSTFVGYFAGFATTTSTENTAVGYEALRNVTGASNTAIGRRAMYGGGGAATRNVALGENAMSAITDGVENIAIGKNALLDLTTSSNNVAIGYNAGQNITTASTNTIVGDDAGESLTTGSANAVFGKNAGESITIHSYNTFIGGQSARNVVGERGVYLGYDAGEGVTSSATGNIMIGMESRPAGTTGNYEIVIGYGTTGKGGQTGFINPIGGGVYQGNNSSSWSTTSDRRIKKNIVDNNDGLEKLMEVQVRNFEYRTKDEIQELPAHAAIQKEGVQLGVIAQEIQEVLPEVVKQETTGCLTVDPGNLTWYLINAVKELKTELDAAKARIATLESQ